MTSIALISLESLPKVVVEKDGASMVVNLEHPSKALLEIPVTFPSMRTAVNETQRQKISL